MCFSLIDTNIVGNIAAFDISDPSSVVSPGGVGFDINCGVRLLRTNLSVTDVEPVKEQLAQVPTSYQSSCGIVGYMMVPGSGTMECKP